MFSYIILTYFLIICQDDTQREPYGDNMGENPCFCFTKQQKSCIIKIW